MVKKRLRKKLRISRKTEKKAFKKSKKKARKLWEQARRYDHRLYFVGPNSLVVYSSLSEVFVCTYKNEKKMLQLWFVENGRRVDDYNRDISTDVLQLKSSHMEVTV